MPEDKEAPKPVKSKEQKEVEELKAQLKVLADVNAKLAQQPSTSVAPETKQGDGRYLRENMTIYHDLYKLNVASMLRNLSWNSKEEPQQVIDVEHTHFFHTVDSSGKKLIYSSPVGGHFHKLKITDQGNHKPPLVECLPGAYVFKKLKINGRWQKLPVLQEVRINKRNHAGELTEKVNDSHTHTVDYIKSDILSQRKLSPEAAKIMSLDAQPTAGDLEFKELN